MSSYVILFDCLEGLPCEDCVRLDLLEQFPHPFRLLDGDGNHCYYGRSEQGPNEDTDLAFAPLDWGKADSGCTTIEYQNQYGEWDEL